MILTILGGGPAGLGVAFYAARAGIPFQLYEKSHELGGMCRTLSLGQHRYDAGAHRFHDKDPDITADVAALMGSDLVPVKAPSKLWNRGRFIDFPPTPMNAALSFGVLGAAKIAFELLRARARDRPRVHFGDFARHQFGETLAQSLLIDYSEKLWGLPAEQLSPDIATRRLQGMTLYSLLLELLRPSKKTQHIDGAFLYPREGFGDIVTRMAAHLPAGGILSGREVRRLENHDGVITAIHFADGSIVKPEGPVVSTLPLTLLVRLLGNTMSVPVQEALQRLRFRQLRLIFLRLDRPQVSDNASIYIPAPEFAVSRVYEPKVRSARMAPAGETSLVVEVPCFPGDALDGLSDDELAARVIGELSAVKLIKPDEVLEWRHHLLPHAYPVYSLDYTRDVATIHAYLEQFTNLATLGRAGNFFYSHLHDQLRMGRDYIAGLAPSAKISPPANGSDDMKVANLSFGSR